MIGLNFKTLNPKIEILENDLKHDLKKRIWKLLTKKCHFLKNVKNTPLLLKIHHGDIFQNTTQKSTFPYLGHEFWLILKSYI